MNEQLYQQCLSLVPLNSMRKDHISALLEHSEYTMRCKDDFIFTYGSNDNAVYYLLSGDVSLSHSGGQQRVISADTHWLPIVQYQRRQFQAQTLNDCFILKVDYQKLDELMTWSHIADYLEIDISYEREHDDDLQWMKTVLNSNLFYKVPPIKIQGIFSKIEAINVAVNEVILHQGDEGDYCYFIKEGVAEVLRQSDVSSVVEKVAEITQGRCFGEDALIQKTVRNATVKMLTAGTLMRLHKDDFMQLITLTEEDHFNTTSLAAVDMGKTTFLDVRTQEEYDHEHLRDATHIPLNLLRLKIRVLEKEQHYTVYCNAGYRSRAAAYLLAQKGFSITLLDGGLNSLVQHQVEEFLDYEESALGYAR